MLKTRDTAKPALTSTSFSCYTFFSFKNIFFKTIVAEICEILSNISNMRCDEKRVENTTRSGVFLTNFEVFHLVMKHCVECLIFLLKQNHF